MDNLEYRLSKTQQRTVKALLEQRQRTIDEAQKVVQEVEETLTEFAHSVAPGQEGQIQFKQEGNQVILLIVPEGGNVDQPE